MAEAVGASTITTQKFSRYRSVRRAVPQHQQDTIAIPDLPPVPDVQQAKTPSRYRRTTIASRTQDVPTIPTVAKGTTRNLSNVVNTKIAPIREKQASNTRPGRTLDRSLPSSRTASENNSGQRSRSRTATSAPKEHVASPPLPRGSAEWVREEARCILEGEYDRLARLMQQRKDGKKAQVEAERAAKQEQEMIKQARQKQKEEAAMEAERARKAQEAAEKAREEREQMQQQRVPEDVIPVPQEPEQIEVPRSRKYTIGGDTCPSPETLSSPPPISSKTLSPASSPDVRRLQSRRAHKSVVQGPPFSDAEDMSSIRKQHSVPDKPSTLLQHRPMPEKSSVPNLKTRKRSPTVNDTAVRTGDGPPQKNKMYDPVAPVPIRSKTVAAGNGPPTRNKMFDKYDVKSPEKPAFDAPVSAVNAGERRVNIEYHGSHINLPVTPTTTVKNLLNSASVIMSQPIDPRTAIVMEYFKQLGLERPLRRYERVRDVMNSWDNDKQNHLVIMDAEEVAATGLEVEDAPKEEPLLATQCLHHSQKPGKWEKHWLILRGDGQVTASRKEKDVFATNVFHMSDFDIYMPTRKQLKHLKAPKKICFAIKSQQKLQMFESTENFVHFFSTNEKDVADAWYQSVQQWRSYYLVNILGEGLKSPDPATDIVSSAFVPKHTPAPSTDSIPYQLGTFKPLLDFSADAFEYDPNIDPPRKSSDVKRSNTHKRTNTLVDKVHARQMSIKSMSPHQRVSSRDKERSPLSAPKRALVNDAHNVVDPDIEKFGPVICGTDAGFTGKGLLARAFSTRRPNEEVVDPGAMPQDTSLAFTGGGLLARSATRKKSYTAGRQGKPLVDLSGDSTFASGSLLQRVESYDRSQGVGGPLIDRAKNEEVNDRVGEAY